MSRITPKIRLIRVNPEIVIKERSMRGRMDSTRNKLKQGFAKR
jgi:hypothetical protein